MPGEFVGVAEATGFIQPLGAFVLETACRDLAHMREVLRLPRYLLGRPMPRDEITRLLQENTH